MVETFIWEMHSKCTSNYFSVFMDVFKETRAIVTNNLPYSNVVFVFEVFKNRNLWLNSLRNGTKKNKYKANPIENLLLWKIKSKNKKKVATNMALGKIKWFNTEILQRVKTNLDLDLLKIIQKNNFGNFSDVYQSVFQNLRSCKKKNFFFYRKFQSVNSSVRSMKFD